MSSFLEYAAQFEVKENQATTAFTTALRKQKASFEMGDFTRRSWVKQDGAGYSIKLGKLGQSYFIAEKDSVIEFLQKAVVAAQSEPEFQALIEAAYGQPGEAAKRRGRKPRTAA